MGFREAILGEAEHYWNNSFTADERKKYQKYWDHDYKIAKDNLYSDKIVETTLGKFRSGNFHESFRKPHNDAYAETLRKDYEQRYKTDNEYTAAESTIRAESTTSAQRAAQTGVPSIDNMSTESDKDTETKRRRNKARGKRGFVVARESGQGINI